MDKLDNKKIRSDDVEFVKIEDICEISRGRVMSRNYIRENAGEYPVYSSQTENNGELGCISEYDFDGEYLTWTTDGANAGSVFYRNGRFSITNVCGMLKINDEKITAKFLYYVLTSEAPRYVNNGMGNPKLMSNVMSKITVPIPPAEIQKKIVKILNRYSESVSKLQKILEREIELRKKQYDFYASELFSDINAEEISMSELAEFEYGYTDTAKNTGNARFIRITDINANGYLKTEDTKFIMLNNESEKFMLKKGDLIMARTGATYGKTLYFDSDFPCVFASFLIRITPDSKKILSKYYWYYTKTSLYWRQADKLVTKGVQPQFNTSAVKKIKIPVPPLSEQKRIVEILDKLDRFCNDITENLAAEIQKRRKQYEYYRDKLLSFKEH